MDGTHEPDLARGPDFADPWSMRSRGVTRHLLPGEERRTKQGVCPGGVEGHAPVLSPWWGSGAKTPKTEDI